LELYYRKRNLVPEKDLSDNQAVYWGHVLEPVVVNEYAHRHAHEPILVEPNTRTFIHREKPYITATPDALCSNAQNWLLEAKTAGGRMARLWGEPGTDVVPEPYLLQVAHSLAVVQFDFADIAVLIGGNDYREYRVPRDRDLEAVLLERATEFWQKNVLAGVPPEPTGTKGDAEVLAKLHPASSEVMLPNTGETEEWALKLKEAEAQGKQAEQLILEAENHLKAIIGDNAGVEGPWGKLTWKSTKDREVTDWQAVAHKLSPPASLLKQYTVTKPGPRRFLARFTIPDQS
jgi:predicted phage-related endonuclease